MTNSCSSDSKLERLSGVKGRLLLGDKDVSKIMVVRNPIVRILSAYLYARKQKWKVGEKSFADFVEKNVRDNTCERRGENLDDQKQLWFPQHCRCGFREGLTYDVVFEIGREKEGLAALKKRKLPSEYFEKYLKVSELGPRGVGAEGGGGVVRSTFWRFLVCSATARNPVQRLRQCFCRPVRFCALCLDPWNPPEIPSSPPPPTPNLVSNRLLILSAAISASAAPEPAPGQPGGQGRARHRGYECGPAFVRVLHNRHVE